MTFDPEDRGGLLKALAVAYRDLDMAGATVQQVIAAADDSRGQEHRASAEAALLCRLAYMEAGGTAEAFDHLAEAAVDGDRDADLQLGAVVEHIKPELSAAMTRIYPRRRGGRPSKDQRDAAVLALIDNAEWKDAPDRRTKFAKLYGQIKGSRTGLGSANSVKTAYYRAQKRGAAPMTVGEAWLTLSQSSETT